MNALGISTDDITQGIEAGKSLVDIAAVHNIDAPTLKSAVLNTYKSQLDAAVKNGSITQSERLAKYNRLLAIEVETGLPMRG